mgnify:CR=1 FL=1
MEGALDGSCCETRQRHEHFYEIVIWFEQWLNVPIKLCEHSFYQTEIWFRWWTCPNTINGTLSKQEKALFRSSVDRFGVKPASNKERKKERVKRVLI